MIWGAFAVCCGVIAGAKGRSSFGWFILGLLFSIFALIVIAVIPSVQHHQRGHNGGPINMSGNPHFSESGRARRTFAMLALIVLIAVLYKRVYTVPPPVIDDAGTLFGK